MNHDNFKMLLESLEKSSDRTRSAYYFFVIINLSAFMYAISAFVYPISETRINPLFGVNVDIEFFWLVMSILGPLMYFILYSNISNEIEQFNYLADYSMSDAVHLRLILATQVLSSPVDYRVNKIIGFYLWFKALQFYTVLLIPILTSILWVLHVTHIKRVIGNPFYVESWQTAWSDFIDDISADGTLVTTDGRFLVAGLIVQLVAIFAMIWILSKVSEINTQSRKTYSRAVEQIDSLERQQ